jgi:hypothetical protein
LALNGYRERPRYDGVRVGALHVPETHLVRQVLVRDPKVLTPLFYVSKPIGRSIRVQPAIRCDAINDDGGVPKNAEKKLDILGVETVDVIIDKGLDFSRGGRPVSCARDASGNPATAPMTVMNSRRLIGFPVRDD